MAVLPLRPAPFFANKNSAFWNLQFAGWGGALLLRAMSALANAQPLSFLVVVIIASITGFAISLVLSVVFRQLIGRRPVVTWGLTGLVLAVAVAFYATIDSIVIGLYRSNTEIAFAQLFLGVFYLDLTLLGAWSALYYAINYFLQLERQADQLEKLEMQATTAQLAMLRYQLNPHFLFNTLNSISTLVLLKQTEPANAMLTRLSSFLRHTLVTEPGSKVTVAQEVETLKLYLEIERMRFEERLRTRFDVEEEAAKACLPAMLLQPLVENAIKYAVSPQEEGAEIRLEARVRGNRLLLVVSDSGPGAQAPRSSLPHTVTGSAPSSTGVGLANIRDRLAQAYGEEHLFEIRSPAQGGFTVTIEIPLERAQEPDNPAPPPSRDTTPAKPQDGSTVINLAERRQIGQRT